MSLVLGHAHSDQMRFRNIEESEANQSVQNLESLIRGSCKLTQSRLQQQIQMPYMEFFF